MKREDQSLESLSSDRVNLFSSLCDIWDLKRIYISSASGFCKFIKIRFFGIVKNYILQNGK